LKTFAINKISFSVKKIDNFYQKKVENFGQKNPEF